MRATTKATLYERIQQCVLAGKYGPEASAYLASLGQAFDELWDDYRSAAVVTHYASTERVNAYRLAYLPHYSYTAFRALSNLPRDLIGRIGSPAGLSLTAVGAGPLPEIIGLVEAAASVGVDRGKIDVTVYDLHAETWRHAIAESAAIAVALSPHIAVTTSVRVVDLHAAPPPRRHADLVTIQNCINEICHEGEPTPALLDVAASIVPGGAVVITELTEYELTQRTIAAFDVHLTALRFARHHAFDRQNDERTPFDRPPARTFYGFYGAEKDEASGAWRLARQPRKNLRFSWATWIKRR